MSAQDNLNGQQFMNVADVGKLQSHIYPRLTVDEWAASEGSSLESYGQSHASRWGYKDEDDSLYAQVKEQGVREPLDISHDHMLMNGHHRYAAAKNAGLSKVPVRHGRMDEAYNDTMRS